jgi:hypothetical protein
MNVPRTAPTIEITKYVKYNRSLSFKSTVDKTIIDDMDIEYRNMQKFNDTELLPPCSKILSSKSLISKTLIEDITPLFIVREERLSSDSLMLSVIDSSEANRLNNERCAMLTQRQNVPPKCDHSDQYIDQYDLLSVLRICLLQQSK